MTAMTLARLFEIFAPLCSERFLRSDTLSSWESWRFYWNELLLYLARHVEPLSGERLHHELWYGFASAGGVGMDKYVSYRMRAVERYAPGFTDQTDWLVVRFNEAWVCRPYTVMALLDREPELGKDEFCRVLDELVGAFLDTGYLSGSVVDEYEEESLAERVVRAYFVLPAGRGASLFHALRVASSFREALELVHKNLELDPADFAKFVDVRIRMVQPVSHVPIPLRHAGYIYNFHLEEDALTGWRVSRLALSRLCAPPIVKFVRDRGRRGAEVAVRLFANLSANQPTGVQLVTHYLAVMAASAPVSSAIWSIAEFRDNPASYREALPYLRSDDLDVWSEWWLSRRFPEIAARIYIARQSVHDESSWMRLVARACSSF